MSEATIQGLLDKRAELTAELQGLQSAIFHIDATLALLGFPGVAKRNRRFGNGELVKLIGEAERAGHTTAQQTTLYVMRAKGMDPNDESLRKRIWGSVKDCRKRTSAVVRAAKG